MIILFLFFISRKKKENKIYLFFEFFYHIFWSIRWNEIDGWWKILTEVDRINYYIGQKTSAVPAPLEIGLTPGGKTKGSEERGKEIKENGLASLGIHVAYRSPFENS